MEDSQLSMLEKFNACRAAVKANPVIVDAAIAKLSPAAQEPAKTLRDLMCSDDANLESIALAGAAIKASVSEDAQNELEAHYLEVVEALGLPLSKTAVVRTYLHLFPIRT